jgi:serine/threonine protein kinase
VSEYYSTCVHIYMGEITPYDFLPLRIAYEDKDAYNKAQTELPETIERNMMSVPGGRFNVPKRLIALDGNKQVLFRLRAKLGSGTFGDVYLYEEENSSKANPRQVAVKVVDEPDECKDTDHYLTTKGTECGLIAQKCLNPPGYGQHDLRNQPSVGGPFFIVMDRQDGDLDDVIEEYKGNEEALGKVVLDVHKALGCLIRNKKGYMDLKPGNVLYSSGVGKVVVRIGDLDGICNLDVKVSDGNYATFPPPEMWVEGFKGATSAPCTEATMTWLMAVLACMIFGVFGDRGTGLHWSLVESYVKGWPRGIERKVKEALETMRDQVERAGLEHRFGSLPTTNLLQCFSVKPECRPPFNKMFSKEKWNPPADCMAVEEPVVLPAAPKVNTLPSGTTGTPVRELQAQIKKAERRVEQLLGNLGRATIKRTEAQPKELTYWKRQEEAAEEKLKRSKNELKRLQEKLPAYIKPRVSTPVQQDVLPPSPPMVPRRLQQNVDINENVILGSMGGGVRSRKTKNTRRKSTRRRKSSRKRR